jgi:hypothetical protein
MILKLSSGARLVVDGESGILLDTIGGRYFSLTRTARDICLALESGTSREAIIAVLSERYAISTEQLTPDCDAFISKLQRLKLCEIAIDLTGLI